MSKNCCIIKVAFSRLKDTDTFSNPGLTHSISKSLFQHWIHTRAKISNSESQLLTLKLGISILNSSPWFDKKFAITFSQHWGYVFLQSISKLRLPISFSISIQSSNLQTMFTVRLLVFQLFSDNALKYDIWFRTLPGFDLIFSLSKVPLMTKSQMLNFLRNSLPVSYTHLTLPTIYSV